MPLSTMDEAMYAKARAEGMSASQALAYVRYKAKYRGHPLLALKHAVAPIESHLSNGLVACVLLVEDTDADLSYLGTFTARQTLDTILHDTNRDQTSYPYFLPAYTVRERMKDGLSHADAMRQVRNDYDRARTFGDQWYMVGVTVSLALVSAPEIELATGSLWGIESDSEPEYFVEVALDLIAEATPAAFVKRAELVAKLTAGAQ